MVSEVAVRCLAWRPNLEIVEAARFEQMSRAMAFPRSQEPSDKQVAKVGLVLSAPLVLLGAVSDEMGMRLVSARLVAAESGEVLCAAAAIVGEGELKAFLVDELGRSVSPPAAAARSAIVPGWGQFYSGHPGHGTVSVLMAAGAAGTLTWSLLDLRDKDDTMELFDRHEPSTMVEGETESEWEARSDAAVAQRNEAAGRTNILIGVTAGVWVLNVIDAVICGATKEHRVGRRYFSVKPTAFLCPAGGHVRVAVDIGCRR